MATKIINITKNLFYGDGFSVRFSIDVQFDVKTLENETIKFFNDKVADRFINVENGNSYRESTDKDYIVKATPSKIISLYKKFGHDINVETIKRYEEQAIEDAHSEYLSEIFEQTKTNFKEELAVLLNKYNIKLKLNHSDEYESTAYLDVIHISTNKRGSLLIADEGECVTFE